METFLIKALQLIAALGLLVIVHEFGHYISARIFGVKVEKFYLFFDPWFSIFKFKPKKKETCSDDEEHASWRDTEYGIGWLPLGGYCKIAGMIDESMDTEQMKQPAKSWEFRAKPAWQRLIIMVAGVVFNFLLAIVIYAGMIFAWGEEYLPFRNAQEGMMFSQSAQKIGFHDGDIPLFADGSKLDALSGDAIMKVVSAHQVRVLRNHKDTIAITIPTNFIFQANKDAENGQELMAYRLPVVVAETQPGMGAIKAGLNKGDQIIAVNNISTPSYDIFKAQLEANKNKTIPIKFIRGNKQLAANVAIDGDGKVGIMLTPINDIYQTVTRKYSIFSSIPRGIELGVEKLTSYVSQMKYVFTSDGAKSLGGFGSLGNIFPDTWNWADFWSITAFFSVMLAFMNILPIPALDGGHVLFLCYELITRRKPSDKFLEYAQIAGMGFLFLLLIYANGNDIYRFFFK